jgi:hypothetical protein
MTGVKAEPRVDKFPMLHTYAKPSAVTCVNSCETGIVHVLVSLQYAYWIGYGVDQIPVLYYGSLQVGTLGVTTVLYGAGLWVTGRIV